MHASSGFVSVTAQILRACPLTPLWFAFRFLEAGGSDEFQGKALHTFTRPDGTQLGTQGMLSIVVVDDVLTHYLVSPLLMAAGL